MGAFGKWTGPGLVLSATLLAACATLGFSDVGATDSGSVTPAALADTASVTVPAFTSAGIAALEASMAQHVADGHVYGIATRLVHKGEVISDVRAGIIRLEDQAPISDDTIYRIYSMSKPITGVAMMMLWEEGAFSLDDPITDYVPEFEGLRVLNGVAEDGSAMTVAVERAPTMREVMSHTAGFAYGLTGTDAANTAFRDREILRRPDLQSFIDAVADVPLLFQPGDAWAYSAAVDIQGYVVEKISGQRFGDFLETRLFAPLGMVDTAFAVGPDDYDRFSEVYGPHPETGQLVPVPYPQVQFKPETIAFESGGGGLTSTMNDYARFCQMLLNGGELEGVRILKPDTIELMRTNVLPPELLLSSNGQNQGETRAGIGFGLDLGVINDPVAAEAPYAPGTYFWGGAAGTWFWIDPVNELFFIGMIQTFERDGAASELREVSADLVYDALQTVE